MTEGTRTKRTEITAEAVLAAIESGATTMSQVVRALGYKSVCGGTTARVKAACPDIGERLKAAGKGHGKAKGGKGKAYPRAESNPYRPGSAYAAAYDVLFAAGDKGIPRQDLVKEVARLTGKTEQRAYYDCVVVCSPTKDGKAHRSADKAADVYWVEKSDGGNVRIRLRDRKF